MMRRWAKRLLTPPLFLLAALFFLVEGALWRLAGLYAWLGRLPVLRQLERGIAGLPPYGALAVFAVPSVMLAPVKFLALYWMAGGHPALGVGTIVTAKVAGTALVARIYQLTRPALVRLGWFAWCEGQVLGAKRAAYEWWRGSAAGRWTILRWRGARESLRAMRERWRTKGANWVRLRWSAVRRRVSGVKAGS
jgi:hypothetical protein